MVCVVFTSAVEKFARYRGASYVGAAHQCHHSYYLPYLLNIHTAPCKYKYILYSRNSITQITLKVQNFRAVFPLSKLNESLPRAVAANEQAKMRLASSTFTMQLPRTFKIYFQAGQRRRCHVGYSTEIRYRLFTSIYLAVGLSRELICICPLGEVHTCHVTRPKLRIFEKVKHRKSLREILITCLQESRHRFFRLVS